MGGPKYGFAYATPLKPFADLLYALPREYHYAFDIIHYIVCLQSVRGDMGGEFESFSRKNPLACWVSCMITCFAGGLLVNPLCGDPILDAIGEPIKVVIATLLWYLMFYCPEDKVYELTTKKPVKIVLYVVKGLYYPKKILAGVKHAQHEFKYNPFAALIVGTLKANGTGIIKPIARLFRGQWTPQDIESMKPSPITKYCFIGTLLYVLFPGDLTYILITGLMVTMKAGPLFGLPEDPLAKVEDAVAPYMFGGGSKKAAAEEKPKEE